MLTAALAVIAFMFIERYEPRLDLVSNIMRAEFVLTPDCPAPGSDAHSILESYNPRYNNCGWSIPYRWLLACLVAIGAAGAVWPNRGG